MLHPVQAAALPTLGDGASSLTTGEERRLGDSIVKELYRDPDYLDDPVLQEYVEGIWLHLQDAARKNGELSQELEERFAWTLLLGRTVRSTRLRCPAAIWAYIWG